MQVGLLSVDMIHPLAGLGSLLVPGLGQAIKGDLAKVIGIWLLLAIALALTLSVIGAIVGVPMVIVVWLVQFLDALIA